MLASMFFKIASLYIEDNLYFKSMLSMLGVKMGLYKFFVKFQLITITCLHGSSVYAEAVTLQPASSACTFPATFPTSSDAKEEVAWKIFVAANCKSTNPTLPLVWETWPEQACLAVGRKDCSNIASNQRLHRSVLAAKGRDLPDLCSDMTRKDNADPKLLPFVPKNLTEKAKFCEEVHANPDETNFMISPPGKNVKYSLLTIPGQQDYVKNNGSIQFPSAAIEIKADWLPATSINTGFSCEAGKTPKDYYVEKIDGKCYALVAMHISSKLRPNWVWATFEPQSKKTNPNRCNPDLYSSCHDHWGSNPAYSTGRNTKIKLNAKYLMNSAKLPVPFYNYRLVGAQVQFDGPVTADKYLGNSFVEFNAGVLPKEASCITCHSYAAFSNTKPPIENTHFGAPPGMPNVGYPHALTGYAKQDFSWLLGFMPATGTVSAGK